MKMSYTIRKTEETVFIQDDKNKYVVNGKDWDDTKTPTNTSPQQIAEVVIKRLGD